MSRDLILRDDADVRYSYDNIKTQSYLEGQKSGLDQAAYWLQEEAVRFFRSGHDDRALALRKMAELMIKDLRPKMDKASEEHQKNHPEILEKE